MRGLYNTLDWKGLCRIFSCPLLVVEEGNNFVISETEVMERLFETIFKCYAHIGLPKVSFTLTHFNRLATNVMSATVDWTFYNPNEQSEMILEIGYVLQKVQGSWRVITLVRPGWEDQIQNKINRDLILEIDQDKLTLDLL